MAATSPHNMKTPILKVDECYKHGLENGMQHALLDMIDTTSVGNSPLHNGMSDTPSYVAGFEQGLQTARRVMLSKSYIDNNKRKANVELTMDIGGEDSDSNEESDHEEISIPPTAFLEDEYGIPVEYLNPIEANSLETSLLTESAHGLSLLHYLRNGYAVYLRWLKDKAHIAGLSHEWDDYFTFALARDINCYARNSKNKQQTSPMGEDIEMIAHAHNDERDFKSITQEEVESAQSKIPTMTTEDFYFRLKKVAEPILDGHSEEIWRGTKGILSSDTFVISLTDLESGKPMAPACGFHLGLKMLEKNGFVDSQDACALSKRNREYKNTRPMLFKD